MGEPRSRRPSFAATLFLVLFLQQSKPGHSAKNSRPRSRKQLGVCNLFAGTWVLDDSYPLYDSSSCPYIDPEFDCQKYGRPDTLYLKYRWKPNDCDLPRFNGDDFLKRVAGKKIMFVGDSLSLNQWQSLACLLHSASSAPRATFSRNGDVSSLTFPDYSVSVMFNRSPYLVDMVRENGSVILKLDSIQSGYKWRGMDMLIFNTWHWWPHTGKDQPWDYIEEAGVYYKDMNRLDAFRKGLATWARWVESQVDPSRTRTFFQGISPTHYVGSEWNEKGSNCMAQVKPVIGGTYPGGLPPAVGVVKDVLSTTKVPVYLLDITTLSQLRKDGHPSRYSGLKTSKPGLDCSHWCLAGVPDTWNELLYAALL